VPLLRPTIVTRTMAVGVALVLGTVLSAAAPAAAAAPRTSRPSAAQSLLASSLAVAGRQSSVHFVATSTVGTRSIRIVANASPSAGTQTVTIRVSKKTGTITGRYVDDAVYFRGNTVGLESYLGMPASIAPTYAGRWISFTSSDQGYSSIAASMTLKSAVAQISVAAPITAGGRTTVGGTPARSVRGTTTALSSKGKHGSATLYVAATGSPLPLVYQGTGMQSKQKETGKVVFTQWGRSVRPVAPSGAVPASSITTPTTSAGSSGSSGSG